MIPRADFQQIDDKHAKTTNDKEGSRDSSDFGSLGYLFRRTLFPNELVRPNQKDHPEDQHKNAVYESTDNLKCSCRDDHRWTNTSRLPIYRTGIPRRPMSYTTNSLFGAISLTV